MFHWISITVFSATFVNSYRSSCLPYAKCFYFHCCCCLVARSYLTLYDPLDCSPPRSFVHEISQARILDWLDTSFSRASSPPRDQTWAFLSGLPMLHCSQFVLPVHVLRRELTTNRERNEALRNQESFL